MRAKIHSERVFVYGTLRQGERNHFWLQGARRLGDHRTRQCFTLLNFGAYPAAIARGRTGIIGEVYAIDEVILRRLDRLEGYPREFTREPISTPYGPAWMYLCRHPGRGVPLIFSGDWCSRFYR